MYWSSYSSTSCCSTALRLASAVDPVKRLLAIGSLGHGFFVRRVRLLDLRLGRLNADLRGPDPGLGLLDSGLRPLERRLRLEHGHLEFGIINLGQELPLLDPVSRSTLSSFK